MRALFIFVLFIFSFLQAVGVHRAACPRDLPNYVNAFVQTGKLKSGKTIFLMPYHSMYDVEKRKLKADFDVIRQNVDNKDIDIATIVEIGKGEENHWQNFEESLQKKDDAAVDLNFVILDEDGNFCGCCGLYSKNMAIHYNIAPHARRKGFGKAALHTLVEFAHKYWPKKDLILFMTMNNEGSANVARSAGFVPLMEKGKQVVK
ncbi:MAG: GNAT family N-acetyltransferase, partial [Alphaproteobacteria bacterium]|nr:GNAT family N-acetyltransferase [Alphaproteobacteria bacterium]